MYLLTKDYLATTPSSVGTRSEATHHPQPRPCFTSVQAPNRASFPLSKPPLQGDRGELNLLFSGNVESVGGVRSCAPAP